MERAFRTILNALRPARPLPRSPGGLRLSAALLLSLAVAACASAPAADPGTVAAPATTGVSVPAPIQPPPGLNIAATPGRPAVYLVDPDEPATATSQTSADNVGERSAATQTLAPKPIAPPVATTDAQGVVHLNPAQAEQAAGYPAPSVARVDRDDDGGGRSVFSWLGFNGDRHAAQVSKAMTDAASAPASAFDAPRPAGTAPDALRPRASDFVGVSSVPPPDGMLSANDADQGESSMPSLPAPAPKTAATPAVRQTVPAATDAATPQTVVAMNTPVSLPVKAQTLTPTNTPSNVPTNASTSVPMSAPTMAPVPARTAPAVSPAPVAVAPLVPVPTRSPAAVPAPPSSSPAAEDADPGTLMLGPGDVVTMNVIGRPELSSTVYVADDGTVDVPLAGKVQVAGLAPADAGRRIGDALRLGQFLVNPQVSLTLTDYRSQQVSVLGEVRSPGRFALATRTSVLDALAEAGGTTELGGSHVEIVRRTPGGVKSYALSLEGDDVAAATFELHGGDTLLVPKARRFYIYGEVRKPDVYRIEPGMTVMQALSVAGGLTERGSDHRIEIRRATGDGQYKTFGAKLSDRIMEDDVVRVKERIF